MCNLYLIILKILLLSNFDFLFLINLINIVLYRSFSIPRKTKIISKKKMYHKIELYSIFFILSLCFKIQLQLYENILIIYI